MLCVINDVINYSVDKMVLVSLNFNEYTVCLPVSYPYERYIKDCKMGVFMIKSLQISHISTKVCNKLYILFVNSFVKFY